MIYHIVASNLATGLPSVLLVLHLRQPLIQKRDMHYSGIIISEKVYQSNLFANLSDMQCST